MKTIKLAVVVSLIAAIAASESSFAVPDTKIAIRCPDVVLWWPSTNGQSFLIQGRPDLNPETTWTTLTNFYPAALNTNRTYFVHSNQVDCPSGQTFGMMSASGGGSSTDSTKESSLSSEKELQSWGLGPWVTPKDDSSMPVPLNIYPPGIDLSGYIIIWPDGSTDEWTKELAEKYEQIKKEEQQNGPQPEDAGGDGTSMAFYRVIDVTPRVRADIFGVEQDSFDNQLDILLNDSDPNDDRLLISKVSSAQHGGISYTPDGSVFQYTPDTSFYGVDSFSYAVTNLHGSWSTATVTVFVNQSGNSRPVAGQTIITLETNSYTAALDVLTNAFDPDTDTMTLYSVGPARLGTVTTNGGGNITYNRNPDWFGRDEFSYVITDGRGGHAIGDVVILQVDSESDGMPDEWEMRNGLDPFADDSADDPDGDGLPNLGEFKLHTNPQVADNPLNLAVPNGAQISGFAQLAVQGLSPVLGSQPIALYVNGNPAANSFLSLGPDGQWLANWNTIFLPNGTNTVKLGFQYNPDVGATSVVFGSGKTVQVTNIIRFDALTSQFTDFLLIDGTLAVQNATVRVDLYDEDNNQLVYGNFSTTNGEIHLYWDLTDGQGNQISFGHVHGRFAITPSGGPEATPVWQWFLKAQTPGPGNTFVSAWGWHKYTTSFNNKTEQMMLDGVLNILGNPSNPNAYFLAPNGNVPYCCAFRFDNSADKQVLLDALAQNRHFFWIGHGSYNGILGNKDRADIGPTDIENILQNLAYKSSPKHPKEDKHPYRLVILNGCQTYSSLWAGCFGIPYSSGMSTNIVLEYQFTGQMPRAFVGWTNDVIKIPFGWDPTGIGHLQYGLALGELFSKWMEGFPLDFCVDSFADRALSYGYTGNDSWCISGCVDLTRW